MVQGGIACLCICIAVACGGDPGARATVDSVPEWTLEPIAPNGPGFPPLELTFVLDLIEVSGDLIVVQPRPAEVLRVGRDGSVERIGRVGDGPGEYQLPYAIQAMGDSLWIADGDSRRMLAYVADESVATITMPSPPFPADLSPLGILDGGGIVMQPQGISVYGALDGTVTGFPIVAVDRTGAVIDTVYNRPVVPEDYYRGSPPTARVGAGSMPVKKTPATSLLREGHGFLVVEREPALADTASLYRVLVLDVHGVARARAEVPYDPIPSGPAMEAYLEDRREVLLAADYSPEDLASSLNGVREAFDAAFPYLPPVTESRATSSGRVWLKRETLGQDSVRWDILDPDLTGVIGYVRLPSEYAVMEDTGERVWAIRLDDYDVPHIVQFRLVR